MGFIFQILISSPPRREYLHRPDSSIVETARINSPAVRHHSFREMPTITTGYTIGFHHTAIPILPIIGLTHRSNTEGGWSLILKINTPFTIKQFLSYQFHERLFLLLPLILLPLLLPILFLLFSLPLLFLLFLLPLLFLLLLPLILLLLPLFFLLLLRLLLPLLLLPLFLFLLLLLLPLLYLLDFFSYKYKSYYSFILLNKFSAG